MTEAIGTINHLFKLPLPETLYPSKTKAHYLKTITSSCWWGSQSVPMLLQSEKCPRVPPVEPRQLGSVCWFIYFEGQNKERETHLGRFDAGSSCKLSQGRGC